MNLPNAEKADVTAEKILNYLLAEGHVHGRHKAAFFHRFGFRRGNWQTLASALRAHVVEHQVTRVEGSRFGTRYIVDGLLVAPDGRRPKIRAVWFVETGKDTPKLVTAYPLERRRGSASRT